jgi:flagellin-like protein
MKAISPILATLLLIVLAVAAIVVTYAWIITYTGNGAMLYKARNVKFYDNGTRSIDIEVGNNGTSDTQILQVYVGTSYSNMYIQRTTPPLPIPVMTGTSPVKITVEYDWTVGSTYFFRIVPRNGQLIEWSEQANVP